LKANIPQHILFVEVSFTGAGSKVLEYCQHQGYLVTIATKRKHAILKFFGNDKVGHVNFLEVDAVDHAQLLCATLELHRLKKIDGITTTNDFFVPDASFLAEQMGLPSLSFIAAMRARNKYLTRTCLEAKGCGHLNPHFQLCLTYEDAQAAIEENLFSFPLVCKLLNANDSMGVEKVSDSQGLKNFFTTWSQYRTLSSGHSVAQGVLLEEFIDGHEYSLETAQPKGQPRLVLGTTIKESFLGTESGQFTELMLSFPYLGSLQTERDHREEINRALDALGIDCGLVHTEFRVTPKGEVKIMEINPRLAGDMLGSHAIPAATGFDTAAAIVEIAFGKADLHASRMVADSVVTILGVHANISGKLERVNEEEIRKQPGFYNMTIWGEKGDWVKKPQSNADLLGRVAVIGRNREESLRRAQNIYQMIKIETGEV
jgi:biotin carboxylase